MRREDAERNGNYFIVIGLSDGILFFPPLIQLVLIYSRFRKNSDVLAFCTLYCGGVVVKLIKCLCINLNTVSNNDKVKTCF